MNRIVLASVLFVQFLLAPFLVSSQTTNYLKSDSTREEGVKDTTPIHRTAIQAVDNASVGGTAGALIAQQMDQQAEELKRTLKGATIERIAEGILISFQSHAVFEPDSYELLPASRTRFKSLARTLNKFCHSHVLIEVHTDDTGEETYNQSLSDKRAKSLEIFLAGDGVVSSRLRSKGYGDKQPLSAQPTANEGQANRRVEVAIFANDEMKAMAQKGEAGEFLAAKK